MPRTLHPGQNPQLDVDADEIADPEGNVPYPAPSSPGVPAEPGTLVVTLTGTETTYGHFYRGDEDPEVDYGAELEPGDLWIDTSGGVGAWVHYRRNAANDSWEFAGPPLDQVLQAGGQPGSAGDSPIYDLEDPQVPQGAATKNYVDTKGPVVVGAVDPGAIGAGHIWIDMATNNHLWKRRNATDDGWDPPFLSIKADDGTIVHYDPLGGEALGIAPDGTVMLGADKLVIAPDGTITLGDGFLTLNPDFTWSINGAHLLAGDGDGVKIDGGLLGTRAAFVANGSTVDQLRDALIASGLMAAS